MQCFTRLGVEDGLLVEKIEHIESFETDDDYVKAVDLFLKNLDKLNKQKIKNISISIKDEWALEILKIEKIRDKIITIELNKDNCLIHGYILDFDENYIQFRVIDNIGTVDGKCFYKISDISSITVEQAESRKRETLYKLKNDLLL